MGNFTSLMGGLTCIHPFWVGGALNWRGKQPGNFLHVSKLSGAKAWKGGSWAWRRGFMARHHQAGMALPAPPATCLHYLPLCLFCPTTYQWKK